MSIELNDNEKDFQDKIGKLMVQIKEQLKKSPSEEEVQHLINEMGDYAFQLHKSLKSRNLEPKHHKYMIKNRGVQPDNPQFYRHVHPVEDLLAFIEDTHSNDEPEDKTLGAKFKFRVYSRRWGNKDFYDIIRTEVGWYVSHMSISGQCNKKGIPFLFNNFDHDSIEYPVGLDGWLEWLWDSAASQGLTKNQVQKALNELAKWVSNTEKNAPSGGVWEGYS